ncbi:protein of unknown function [Candidatus Methylomirabilis oxygeniifera]|uniref:Uncharacterized protein n=1 Tax=Methylomirabilis oxygeniifera TaxID=671143 RepID=D5MHL2_METO1|nr:protein of unknown function [Candidatus Methylomirabilis oxyfera]
MCSRARSAPGFFQFVVNSDDQPLGILFSKLCLHRAALRIKSQDLLQRKHPAHHNHGRYLDLLTSGG